MKRNRQRRVEILAALLFLLPNTLGFLAFTIIPVLASLALAFFNWSPLAGTEQLAESAQFVGLKNFWGVVGSHVHADGSRHANDPFFWKYLGNTLFLMLGIPLSIMGSLMLANLLAGKIKGSAFYITVFFLPSITAGVPTFMIWWVLLNAETGLVNHVLALLHLDGLLNGLAAWMGVESPLKWLISETWAKPSLIMMGLWQSIGGYNMVLYLAALQSIPDELYEAADLDGASSWQRFVHITLPMVSPTTFFIFTMSLIAGFQGGFAAAYIMTQGGPAGATTTVSYYIYNLAFSRSFEMGYASAVAWVLFLITFILALLNWRYGRKHVHGDFGV